MHSHVLFKYLDAFGSLHRNKGTSPHKPVLLLSVLDEIGKARIIDNQIILTVELVATFREYWQALPLPPGNWQQRIHVPYRYLIQDGFWELVKNEKTLTGKEAGEPTSISDARSRISYAQLAPDLWELLQDDTARTALHGHLLQTCFGIGAAQVQPVIPADPIAAQVFKLIADAQRQPRRRLARTVNEGDVEYLRSQLFPNVIYSVYNHACAVCDLRVTVGDRPILQAAHIKPFAEFGNNHPSNGLALCYNHHWAFDRGGFSINDDFTVVVSPKLTGTPSFVIAGSRINLPAHQHCHPSPEALSWHRANRYLA